MHDISKLEERGQTALDLISAAMSGFDAFAGGGQSDSDDLSQDIAERDARIEQMAQELDALRTQLAEGEEDRKMIESRRKHDLAELDEIIEQLEPLIQGRM